MFAPIVIPAHGEPCVRSAIPVCSFAMPGADPPLPVHADGPGTLGVFEHARARRLLRYAVAVLLVGAAHAVVAATGGFIGPAMTSVFLAAVIIAALHGGRGPGLLATVLAALDLDYTFTPPIHSFALVFNDLVWLVAFFAVALLTSSLQGRRQRAEELLRAAHRDLQRTVEERTAALARSREQFSLLVNGTVDQAVFLLDAQGRIASWNAGARRLLGYEAAEMEGRHVSILWPALGGSPVASRPLSDLADARYEDQAWVSRKGAERIWANLLLTPLQDARNRPMGFAAALRDMTERRSLEQEIVEISEREQQRIGHDLHDGLGQELTGIAMLATALAERLETSRAADAQDAERISDLIHDAIAHTRSLARGLCPVDLEDEGLALALQRLCARIEALPGIDCRFDLAGDVHVDPTVASHLYRIAQEAINNAMRHGKAHEIRVALAAADQGISLTVADDGRGFPVTPDAAGLGLRLMRYRAKMIRGALRIAPSEGGGTVVECAVGRSDS